MAVKAVRYVLCLALPFSKGQVQLNPGTIPPLMKSECSVLPSEHVFLCSVEIRFHNTAGGSSQKFRQTLGHHKGPIQPPPSLPSGNHREVITLEQTQMLKKRGDDGKKPLHRASSREQRAHPTAVSFVLHILHIYIHKIFPNIPVFI